MHLSEGRIALSSIDLFPARVFRVPLLSSPHRRGSGRLRGELCFAARPWPATAEGSRKVGSAARSGKGERFSSFLQAGAGFL